MTDNIKKALELLETLNKEYEKTKNSLIAEKIFLLVKNELISDWRNLPREEASMIQKTFIFKPIINHFMKKSPYRYFREIYNEKVNKQLQLESERLEKEYSLQAKTPSQKKEEEKNIQKEVFNAVNYNFEIIVRDILLREELAKRILESKPIIDTDSLINLINISENNNKKLILLIAGMKDEDSIPVISDSNGYIRGLAQKLFKTKTHEEKAKEQMIEDENFRMLSQRSNYYNLLNEILDERLKQINKYGYSPEHDDEHTDGCIADAAAYYASTKDNGFWPWDESSNKKEKKTRREQLVSAIAMLMAEIERIDRIK